MKRYYLILGTILAIVGAIAFGLPALEKIYWAGHREIEVVVIVRDASELTTIANANIEILDGPYSLETPSIRVKEFEARNDQKVTTDDSGRAEFPCRFSAYGSDSLFHKSGYVDTDGVWLRVTAKGYHTTYMPVDRQSLRPRDIKDETPVFVTVPVAKLQPKTEN